MFLLRKSLLPHQPTVRTFSTNLKLFTSKDLLWNKNVSFDDKISFYRTFKNDANDLLEMIDVCLLTTNNCFMMKKEKELKECLTDLKTFCSQLNEGTEKKLNDRSWNYVIQHFCRDEGYYLSALYWFKRMKEKELASANIHTLSSVLKACSFYHGNIGMCEEIVNELDRNGAMNVFLYSYFVNACIKNNNLERSLEIVREMKRKNIEPHYGIYIPLFKAATLNRNLQVGVELFKIVKNSNLASPQLSMSIISFALKLKKPEFAIEEIDHVKKQKWMTLITWNCLIQAYTLINDIKKAIGVIREMKDSGINPDSTTFNILITACANSKLFEEGKLIHQIAAKTLKIDSLELSTSIINFYTKCGHAEIAIEECEKMKLKGLMNVVSWNCLIQAHVKKNDIKKAIQTLNEMQQHNISPNATTFNIVLSACTSLNLYEEGKLIHELSLSILKENSIELSTAIINFYTKCGHAEIAIKECEKLKLKGLMNVVSWTCLIQAHIQMNCLHKGIETLSEMKHANITPNSTTFNILITACANSKLYEEGKLIHKMANETLKEPSVQLSTSIINFYTKCGHAEIAIKECEKLTNNGVTDTRLWNSLIKAYIQGKDVKKSISLLSVMRRCGAKPDSATFTILITACADTNMFEEGILVLKTINEYLQDYNSELATAIINFYTKCGYPKLAISEFKKLKFKNIATWNCLIQAHIQMNDIKKAILLIDEMRQSGVEPDGVTFTILITACANSNLYEEGKLIHQLAFDSLKIIPSELSTSIINFYTKCGHAEIAIEECEKLKLKGLMNVVSWTCLIQAYLQLNNIKKSIEVINLMNTNNCKPNANTLNILITACAKSNLFEEGKLIHKMANETLKEPSVQLSTSIINFYTKCGHAEIAIEECEKLKLKGLMNIATWNCLIQAHIQMNDIKKAIQLIDEMRQSGVEPDGVTFTILITACANSNLYEEGKFIHQVINTTYNNITDSELSTAIINFYTKCGHAEIAIEECEKLKLKGLMNIATWNCLIQAHIQMNDIKKAIQLIDEMRQSGVEPDGVTFTILITACANSNLFEEGKLIHQLAFDSLKIIPSELSTAIINFYTKCGHAEIAIEECEKLKLKGLMNVVSWNCLIQAHIQMNDIKKAIQLIDEMRQSGVEPDGVTFTILIIACANSNLYEEGKLIHQLAFDSLKIIPSELSTSIINFYTKCGHAEIAIEECEKLKLKGLMNIATWNCLIQAHIQNTKSTKNPSNTDFGLNKAMSVLHEMKENNIEPDRITYLIVMAGCGEFVAKKTGLNIVKEIILKGMDAYEEIISVMIYFYSRIADHETAQKLFEYLVKQMDKSQTAPSIITYNNMLKCYAQHGKGIQAKELFSEMIDKGVEPNDSTFTIILNAFSHCGLVDEAIKIYDMMKLNHNHNSSVIVDCAMVDVFARAGRFEEAERIINGRTDYNLWSSMMAGCRKFNNIKLGEKVFTILTTVDEKQAPPYVLLSHIYTYYGLNEKANNIRKLMDERGIKKIPGIVYHEENGQVYQFISGSDRYDKFEEIEKMREKIYRKIIKAGFEPDTRWVTNSKFTTEEEKLNALCRHAEKTAIAHAFVLNPKRKSIILTKNLRVCNDCHNATAFISKVMKCEIIVRDANRYHHFKDGKCSCDNYW